MEQYQTMHLVKSEDLNHHGTLFAARTASWFVEAGFIAVASAHGDPAQVVCRNMHGMSFKHPVRNGSLVKLTSRVVFTGETSLMVYISVLDCRDNTVAVDGYMTFVTVEEKTGKKIPHGIVLDEAADEEERQEREEALRLRKSRTA